MFDELLSRVHHVLPALRPGYLKKHCANLLRINVGLGGA
jgi:hypothetical protein